MGKSSKISQQYRKWCGGGREITLWCIWKGHRVTFYLPPTWSWSPAQELMRSWECRLLPNSFTPAGHENTAGVQHERGVNVEKWRASAFEVLHSQGQCEPNCLWNRFLGHRDTVPNEHWEKRGWSKGRRTSTRTDPSTGWRHLSRVLYMPWGPEFPSQPLEIKDTI